MDKNIVNNQGTKAWVSNWFLLPTKFLGSLCYEEENKTALKISLSKVTMH